MSKGALKFAASTVSQTIFLTGTKSTVESDQHAWARKSKCAVLLSIRYMWFVPREYEWHPPVPCWGSLLFTVPVSFSFDPHVSLQSLGETCACISPIRQKASVRGSHHQSWGSTKVPEGVRTSSSSAGSQGLLTCSILQVFPGLRTASPQVLDWRSGRERTKGHLCCQWRLH